MAMDLGFLLDNVGKLAQTGISTIAQAQAQQSAKPRRGTTGCTPCAAKKAVADARARIAKGKL